MADGGNIFYNGRKDAPRERVLRELGAGVELQPTELEALYKERVDAAYQQLADVINAANAVLPAYEEAATALSIPVDAVAQNVRSAVARKDQNIPDGSVIRFDLFKDAIENYDRLRNAVADQASRTVTGNPVEDAERIEIIRRRVENGDLNADELIIFSSVFIIRYLLSKTQDQFTVPVTQTMVAGKFPAATEVGPSISSIILSILISVLVDIAQEAALAAVTQQRFTDQDNNRVATNETIVQAQNTEPVLTKLQQLGVRRVGEGDYQAILEYALDFLAATDDRKYDAWLAYMDSTQIRNNAIQSYQFGPQYSEQEFELLNNAGQESTLVISETVITAQAGDINLTPGLLGTISMSPEHLCVIEEKATTLQQNLTLIAQVMSSRYAADVICCLVRIFGNFDQNTLKVFKAIVIFARGLLSQRYTLNMQQTLSNLLGWITNGIQDFLISFMERMVSIIVEPLLELIDIEDDEYNLVINGCPLFQILMEFILTTIRLALQKLKALIQALDFSGLNFNLNIEERYTSIYEARTFKIILDLIDRIFFAIVDRDCEIDRDGRIAVAELAKISDTFVTAQKDYTVDIPETVLEQYFPDTEPRTFEATNDRPEITIPAINDSAEGGDEKLIMKDILTRCGRTISDEDIDRIFKATNGID